MFNETKFYDSERGIATTITHVGHGYMAAIPGSMVESFKGLDGRHYINADRAPDLKLACELYKKTAEMVAEAFAVYTRLCEQRSKLEKCITGEIYARGVTEEKINVDGLLITNHEDGATIEIIKTLEP